MKDIIKLQLNSVTATTIDFDDSTVNIFIPKTININNASMQKGQVYIIELNDSITNPSENSTLASNWNNGKIPKYDKYIVEVNDNVAKMIKVTGVAVDDNTSLFVGWLPHNGFTVLSKFT